MRYRRNLEHGGTFFFTAVTRSRQPLFSTEPAIEALRRAFKFTKEKYPFNIDAIVVLPDHIHCIWSLPTADSNYSLRWRMIKTHFTRLYIAQFAHGSVTEDKPRLWQPRYWEHTIQNERDLAHHIDYIHYNPVKHGLAATAQEWKYSSFHRYVASGAYPANWAAGPSSLGYDQGE